MKKSNWAFGVRTVAFVGCTALLAGLIYFAPVGCTQTDIALQTLLPVHWTTDKPVDTEKVVYLTFDDGPSRTTSAVLDALYAADVHATFFVIAAPNNEKYLPLLKRTVAEGHLVGLHSCSHEYKTIYASPEAYWQDIALLQERLTPYGCGGAAVLRFPGGSTNTVSRRYGGRDIMTRLKEQANEKGFQYVDWNVCAEDAIGGHISADEVYNNVIREAGDKHTCVVLMHDTNATKSTAQALPDIIAWFRAGGYRFDTVDHLDRQI